jgi:hypothetical protein
VIKPVLQALVLADNVYQDKFTGKMIIAGTFNQLYFTKAHEKPAENQPPTQPFAQPPDQPSAQPPGLPFPAGGRQLTWQEVHRSGSPYAYVSVTGIRDTVPLELRYLDLADNTVLFVIKFTVKSDDPLKTIEAVVPVPPLPTPHPGVYVLELLFENEPLGSHRITAIDSPPKSK